MRAGRVLTSHMEIEPRQHDLLGLDLGEGPKRKTLVFGLVSLVVWCALLAPFLGVPTRLTFSLYFLPPIIITIFGIRPSTRTRRRQTLTDWALSARYALLGHRPVIRLGQRRAGRGETLPLMTRWSVLRTLVSGLSPRAQRPPWATPERDERRQRRSIGRPVTLEQKPTLIGSQAMYEMVVAASAPKKNRKAVTA